jgi:hypothetical protein
MRLAVKEWRVDFVVDDHRILVRGVRSGYRAKALATDPALVVHSDYEAEFGGDDVLEGATASRA